MPKKPDPAAETKTEAPKALYTVLIDGADHAVWASDADDLQKQIARIREQTKA